MNQPIQLEFEQKLKTLKLHDSDVISKYFGDRHTSQATTLYFKCVDVLIQNLNGRLENLKRAIDQLNHQDIKFYSHQLKGSFGTTGSPLLYFILSEVETNCSQLTQQELMDLLSRIELHSAQFVKEVQEFRTRIEV